MESKEQTTHTPSAEGIVSTADVTELTVLQLQVRIAHLGHYATHLEHKSRRPIAEVERARFEAELATRDDVPVLPSYSNRIKNLAAVMSAHRSKTGSRRNK